MWGKCWLCASASRSDGKNGHCGQSPSQHQLHIHCRSLKWSVRAAAQQEVLHPSQCVNKPSWWVTVLPFNTDHSHVNMCKENAFYILDLMSAESGIKQQLKNLTAFPKRKCTHLGQTSTLACHEMLCMFELKMRLHWMGFEIWISYRRLHLKEIHQDFADLTFFTRAVPKSSSGFCSNVCDTLA